MASNLAPWRICLLMIIEMYCNGLIPADGRLTVLSFITAHLLPHGSLKGKQGRNFSNADPVTIFTFKDLLMPLKDPSASRSIWDGFVAQVSKISDLDTWFEFMEHVQSLLPTKETTNHSATVTVLAVPSLFGVNVRRAYLEFTKLDFQDAVRLWQNFEHFVQELPRIPMSKIDDQLSLKKRTLSLISQERIQEVLESNAGNGAIESNARHLMDAEKLLVFQINQMQKLGNRLSNTMRDRLVESVLGSLNATNLSNYIRFLDAWFAGDYPSSFENLHRYYDYALLNKDRSQYQYALLNTAIIQADLGCREEAIAAMQETIMTARENKDMPCLNFSLSWLYHFRTMYGSETKDAADKALLASDVRSLAFLKAKAHENKMWSVVSATMLNEARLYLSQGRRPLEAIERVYESSYLNVQQHVSDLRGAQLLVQASCFDRIGVASLGASYRSIVTPSFLSDLPFDDFLRAICQASYLALIGGNYKKATAILDQVKMDISRSLKFHQLLVAYRTALELKRSLHRNDLDMAELYLAALRSTAVPDRDFTFEIAMFDVEYHRRRLNYEQVFRRIEELAEQNDAEGRGSGSADVVHRLRLMTKKALVFVEIDKPQKGLSLGLRATVAALEMRILPAVWEAAAALCRVLISLEEAQIAKDILAVVVRQASEAEDAALSALVQDTYSAASFSRAISYDERVSRESELRESLQWAQRAAQSYGALEDLIGQENMALRSTQALEILGDAASASTQSKIADDLRKQQKHEL